MQHTAFLKVLLAVALVVAVAKADPIGECLRSRPTQELTWGSEGYLPGSPGEASLTGWRVKLGLTEAQFNATVQEAFTWYRERYGIDTTLLAYDPSSGIGVFPQGYMVPTYLNASGNYRLWSSNNPFTIGNCYELSVIELVFFFYDQLAGTPYSGAYGDWARVYNPGGSNVSVGDVVSIGRYLIEWGNNNEHRKVYPFKTWYPVRKDFEQTNQVTNILYDEVFGWGFTVASYQMYQVADDPQNRWWHRIRAVMKWPYIEDPPMAPPAAPAAAKRSVMASFAGMPAVADLPGVPLTL